MVVVAMAAGIATIEAILYFLFTYYKSKLFEVLTITMIVGITALALDDKTDIVAYGIAGVFSLALALIFRVFVRGRMRFPFLMMAPAFVSIALLVIYPFFFEIRLSLANINMYTINDWLLNGNMGWVGWTNFYNVFTSSPLQTATFWQLFYRTLLWTFINVVFHVFFGLGIAMLLNRKIMAKGFYRTLLIVPWAMPQIVAVLAWRGEFHPKFGLVNQILAQFNITEVNWWSDPLPVFISCCIVNIWLGIPFMTIVFLGGLQSIPKSLYEAASIDGASKWQQFKTITLPMLQPVVVPSITLGTIWTFNNINVIYLMTGQDGGNEFADILVTALYKSAFTYSRFSFSAAFALVICAILLLVTVGWIKISRATDNAGI